MKTKAFALDFALVILLLLPPLLCVLLGINTIVSYIKGA